MVLRKKRANLREAFDLLASMPEDFCAEGRQDLFPEIRKVLMTAMHYLLDTNICSILPDTIHRRLPADSSDYVQAKLECR